MICELFGSNELMMICIFRFCVLFTLLMMVMAHIREGCRKDVTEEENHSVDHLTQAGITSGVTKLPSSPSPDFGIQRLKISVPTRVNFDEIVECFSLRKNIQMLVNVKKPVDAVPAVDGLKCVSNVLNFK